MNKKVGIKVKFQTPKHQKDLTEMGISLNGWSYSFLVAMNDEQLRCVGKAIFRHLAKKSNGDKTEV